MSEIISSDLDESQESIFWCKKKRISAVWQKIGIPECIHTHTYIETYMHACTLHTMYECVSVQYRHLSPSPCSGLSPCSGMSLGCTTPGKTTSLSSPSSAHPPTRPHLIPPSPHHPSPHHALTSSPFTSSRTLACAPGGLRPVSSPVVIQSLSPTPADHRTTDLGLTPPPPPPPGLTCFPPPPLARPHP